MSGEFPPVLERARLFVFRPPTINYESAEVWAEQPLRMVSEP